MTAYLRLRSILTYLVTFISSYRHTVVENCEIFTRLSTSQLGMSTSVFQHTLRSKWDQWDRTVGKIKAD